jgi:hypothetical protein
MYRTNLMLSLMLLLSCIIFSGCTPQPIDQTRFFSYNQTVLGQTTSADELSYMQMSLTTLVSQSDTVIASWGEEKKGYQEWLNLVAFDEEKTTAVRKYFFFVDEKAHHIPFMNPKWTARFDSELQLDKAVLEKPYADQKVRSIAILKEIQKVFGDDIAKVSSDNKMLGICQMVVNESFGQIQAKLADSPEWASKLDTPEGMQFDHRSYDTGTVRLHEQDGVVIITIQTGVAPWTKGQSEPGRPYDPNSASN